MYYDCNVLLKRCEMSVEFVEMFVEKGVKLLFRMTAEA